MWDHNIERKVLTITALALPVYGYNVCQDSVLRLAQRSICAAFRNPENSGLVALDFCNRRLTNGARVGVFRLSDDASSDIFRKYLLGS